MTVDLKELSAPERQNYLQHAVAPRPIGLVSSVDSQGNANLSPFSFFNMVSSTPPLVIFSPCRRIRDCSTKHSLENVLEVPEVVIHMVDYAMVHQTNLASGEYPRQVNEFGKAGFTAVAATLVRPPMVLESKVKLECKVIEVKSLGDQAGSGNLVICEVLLMHIDDHILDSRGQIDQTRLHHVARLGGDWYCLVDQANLFELPMPKGAPGMGVDALPGPIRTSEILSGNDLGRLAGVAEQPSIDAAFHDDRLTHIIQYFGLSPDDMEKELHRYAKDLLSQGKVQQAWQILLAC